MTSNRVSRLLVLHVGILLAALVLGVQLFRLQVLQGKDYRELADRQYTVRTGGGFDRGSIYFTERDGNLIGAGILETGYTIAINPEILENPEDTYTKLSEIISLERDPFFEKAGKTQDPYEEIAKRATLAQAEKIRALKMTGVIIEKDKWRSYPGNRTASHVLGFVGYKGDTLTGRYGLEAYYNDTLTRGESNLYSNFFAQAFSITKALLEKNGAREGNIVTSIEPSVQGVLETELKELMEKWHSELSGGVIIDPKTGEIYAMANTPDYDPNNFSKEKNSGVFLNPIVEGVYEMGSIMKPLTLAAGIDTGAITPSTTYKDEGFVVVDGARINNFDGKGRGVVPMQDILDESLNTGAVFVMERLGKQRFRDYMESFGFTEETGIDLLGEVSGSLRNLEENLNNKRLVEYATASFGQGIAMTPIQMIRALSSLANGGFIVTPHVVKRVEYSVGFPQDVIPDLGVQVLKKSTSEEVTRMLVHVVDNFLQGGVAKMEHYSIAAKTGTAQIAHEDGGKGYYDDRYLHTFFGYFPAYEPRFLVFLYTKHPKEVRYAATTLTSPFVDITKFLINYYNIPPDR